MRNDFHGQFALRLYALLVALLTPCVALCQSATTTAPAATQSARPRGLALLRQEARALRPLVETDLARRFLAAVDALPSIAPRMLLREPDGRRWFTPAAAAALPEDMRGGLTEFPADEHFYYYTAYGSPLAYMRALEVLAERTEIEDLKGRRVLDFGYGGIGHLRLMAALGADAVGLEVAEFLAALYCEPEDQGPFPQSRAADETSRGGVTSFTRSAEHATGRVTLVHGRWPAEAAEREKVGGNYDLILSKNTLKNGYLNPARPVDPKQLVQLGVSHEEFVRALHEALRPDGIVLIYNLSPAPAGDDEPYIPWADGRCPFPREMLTEAGFEILAFDVNDDEAARRMFQALEYPTETADGRPNLFARYTLLRRPG